MAYLTFLYLISKRNCSIYKKLQLGSGQNYNVTLNLSGVILLGLGLSTALMAYMFLNAFKDDGDSSTSYGYESYGYESSGTGYGRRKGYLGRKGNRNKVITRSAIKRHNRFERLFRKYIVNK